MPYAKISRIAITGLLALLLAACGGADRDATASAPARAESSSSELIDAAQVAGEIDADTALAYRAHALFGDARLPLAYRGALAEEYDSSAAAALQAGLATASPSTRAALAPYFRRPDSAGSWATAAAPGTDGARVSRAQGNGAGCSAPAAGWQAVVPAGGRFAVWHADDQPADAPRAAAIADALEQDAWRNLLASRGLRARIAAGAAPGCAGKAHLHLYLVRGIAAAALTIRSTDGASPFVLLDADAGAAAAADAAVREVAQALRSPAPADPPSASPARSRALAAALAEPAAAVPPSIVQSKGASLGAGTTTLALDNPVAAGNWIAVAVSSINLTPRSVLLSDSQGHNDAAFAQTGLRYSKSFGTVWRYVKLAQPGAYSLSINRGTASSATVQLFELAGVDADTFNDIAAASATGTGRTAASTFASATVTPNDLLLSVVAVRSTTATVTPDSPAGLSQAGRVQDAASSATVYGLGVNATATYRIAAAISARNQWRISSLAVRGATPPPVVLPPVNTAPPVVTLSGTATPYTLTASQGGWSNAPTSYAYSWLRNGEPIADAAASSYTTTVSDEGQSIAVTVTASNSAGGASATSAAVQIPLPPPPGVPTLALTASPASITAGQSSTLAWTSTNATACTAGGAWNGPQATSGNLLVTPAETATYTLDCAGDIGTASAQATVTVSAAPPPAVPTTGAHAKAFHASKGSVGAWLPTPPMATQASGSTMLVFVAKGSIWNLAPPIDNLGNSPYIQIGTIHQYKLWPGEGTAAYAFNSMVGGANHIVSVNDSNVWDEVTFAAVEVKNGGLIVDHKWNEVLNSPTHTSLSVTTTGPATLVAAWFGDTANYNTPSIAIPSNGFTVREAVTDSIEIPQMTIATKDVPAAGTYNVTWSATPLQGAQLYLFAVQKKP